jgi:hypothetical protein
MSLDPSRQMRSILARMELLPHGTIMNYSPTGGGGSADTKPPTGELRPPHEHWAKRWEQAVYDDLEEEHREATTITRHRRRVIEKAQADLDGYRKRAEGEIVGETESELEARVVREGDGWTAEQTAQHCRCTPTFVRKARLKAGRSVVTGEAPRDTVIDHDDDLRSRALKLKREGVSGRGIRLILKIGGSKLDQLLREAA